MGKKIEVNLSNKSFYSIVLVLALLLIATGVYAYGTDTPTVMGHSAGEIELPGSCDTGEYVYVDGSGDWNCRDLPSFEDNRFGFVEGTTGSGSYNSGSYYLPSGFTKNNAVILSMNVDSRNIFNPFISKWYDVSDECTYYLGPNSDELTISNCVSSFDGRPFRVTLMKFG